MLKTSVMVQKNRRSPLILWLLTLQLQKGILLWPRQCQAPLRSQLMPRKTEFWLRKLRKKMRLLARKKMTLLLRNRKPMLNQRLMMQRHAERPSIVWRTQAPMPTTAKCGRPWAANDVWRTMTNFTRSSPITNPTPWKPSHQPVNSLIPRKSQKPKPRSPRPLPRPANWTTWISCTTLLTTKTQKPLQSPPNLAMRRQ